MSSKKTKLTNNIRYALMNEACKMLRDPDDDREITMLRTKLLNTFGFEYAAFAKLPDLETLAKYGQVVTCTALALDNSDAADVLTGGNSNSEWSLLRRSWRVWGDDMYADRLPLPEPVRFVFQACQRIESYEDRSKDVYVLRLSHIMTKDVLPETFDAYKNLTRAYASALARREQLMKDMHALLRSAATLEEVEEAWPEASAVRAKLDIRHPEAKLPAVISDELRQRLCENFKKRGISSTSTICGAINPTTGLAEGGAPEAAE